MITHRDALTAFYFSKFNPKYFREYNLGQGSDRERVVKIIQDVIELLPEDQRQKIQSEQDKWVQAVLKAKAEKTAGTITEYAGKHSDWFMIGILGLLVYLVVKK